MANYRDGFEGMISGINNTVAANMNNPNKIKPKSGKGSQGVTPDFVNLAAYTEIMTKKNAAQRAQEMMNAQNQKEGTVAEQIISSVSNTGRDNQQGIASQMGNVLAQQKKNMANKNRKGIMPPQGMPRKPMVAQNRPPMPQGMPPQGMPQRPPMPPQGIMPPQGMPQRPPVMRAARGGIIGFQAGGAVDQLKALLSGGNVTKDMLQRQLGNLGLVGIGNINELVAFLQRQGETDLATQVQNAPAQRSPQTSGQLTTDTDLKDTLKDVGAPDDSTKKIKRPPPNFINIASGQKSTADLSTRPSDKELGIPSITDISPEQLAKFKTGTGRGKLSDEEAKKELLKQRLANQRPNLSTRINPNTPQAQQNLANIQAQKNLLSSAINAQAGIPSVTGTGTGATGATGTGTGTGTGATGTGTGATGTGATATGATGTDATDTGGIKSLRQQVVDTLGNTVDAGKMDTSTPITDAFAKAPVIDPNTGENTGGLGLMADAIQDSQKAGKDAQKTVLDTYGIGTDKKDKDTFGKFKEKTASQQQIDELRKYDTSDEAKRAQKQAEDAAFAVNLARTGTMGGGVEGLQRERSRDRKAGRDAIIERGDLRRIDEKRMDSFQKEGLDRMFTSIAESNRAKEAARNTIANLTETDQKNERARLDRELTAKAENNRNLQAALKIISDIDYKKEALALQKAQNDGTILNYITQRNSELITAVGEVRNNLADMYRVDDYIKKAKGKPPGSKEQMALDQVNALIERQIILQIGEEGDALLRYMSSLVDESLADELKTIKASKEANIDDILSDTSTPYLPK